MRISWLSAFFLVYLILNINKVILLKSKHFQVLLVEFFCLQTDSLPSSWKDVCLTWLVLNVVKWQILLVLANSLLYNLFFLFGVDTLLSCFQLSYCMLYWLILTWRGPKLHQVHMEAERKAMQLPGDTSMLHGLPFHDKITYKVANKVYSGQWIYILKLVIYLNNFNLDV